MKSLNAALGKLGDSHGSANCTSSSSERHLLEVLFLRMDKAHALLVRIGMINGIDIDTGMKWATNLEEGNNTAQKVRSRALGVDEDLILLATLLGHNNLVIAIHGRAGGTARAKSAASGTRSSGRQTHSTLSHKHSAPYPSLEKSSLAWVTSSGTP